MKLSWAKPVLCISRAARRRSRRRFKITSGAVYFGNWAAAAGTFRNLPANAILGAKLQPAPRRFIQNWPEQKLCSPRATRRNNYEALSFHTDTGLQCRAVDRGHHQVGPWTNLV